MPVTLKYLRVLANPWVHNCVDHKGRPAAHLPVEPNVHSPQPVTFVGCKMVDVIELVPPQTFRVGKVKVETAPAVHDHRFAYSKKPVEVLNTGYYRAAIACGDLIAADAKTAGQAGVKFVAPDLALKAARKAAIEHFNASTGEDAHAEMQKVHEHNGEPLWLEDIEAAAVEAAKTKPAAAVSSAAEAPQAPVDEPAEAPESDDKNDPKGSL